MARYYAAGAIPADSELEADLRRFLGLYQRLIEANNHLADADTPTDDPDDGDDEAGPSIEGRRLRWHLRAERNPTLVKDAKRIHGSTCSMCGFRYADRYGEIGEGYIEAHHLTPFADLEG